MILLPLIKWVGEVAYMSLCQTFNLLIGPNVIPLSLHPRHPPVDSSKQACTNKVHFSFLINTARRAEALF